MGHNNMQNYDPMLEIDVRQWNLLDDDERNSLVMEYHREVGIELPDEYTHAMLHVIVENQIALQEEVSVEATLHRLIEEGLDRHDAVHAIANILASHTYKIINGDDATYGHDHYYAELGKITAEKWQRGDYTEG